MSRKMDTNLLIEWFENTISTWTTELQTHYRNSTQAPWQMRTLETLYLLHKLDLDQDTLIATYLFISQADIKPNELQATLIEGLSMLEQLTHLSNSQQNGESLRKMLLAMTKDLRTILIMIAHHVVNMRHIREFSENEQLHLAQTSSKLFAPLANRLGLAKIKWELEDLSLRYYHPETYKQLAKSLDERRVDREKYIINVIADIKKLLDEQNIKAEVSGRVKHLYSIWRKMENKQRTLDELFDVRAVRIMVENVADCYTVLGMVHEKWLPIPKEFDDYIANPKLNGYQSLHTAVLGPEDKTLEVQIRTFDMHKYAELGVAAHWQYKEGNQASNQQEALNALRQVLEKKGDAENLELADENIFETHIFGEFVYVLTPKGQAIELVAGATPLDFAYQIHTDLGHRCRGAKVNGRIVPLTQELTNGDTVDILTTKLPAPSRDWLSPHLGYLKSSRARAKVRAWFKQQDQEKNQLAGKSMIEKELTRLDIHPHNDFLTEIAHKLSFNNAQELYGAMGAGDITLNQFLARLPSENKETRDQTIASKIIRSPKSSNKDSVSIRGVDNLLTTMATCCQPAPPELIGGYITMNRGVSIHKADCLNYAHLLEKNPERRIDVDWENQDHGYYLVDISITAMPHSDLLKDISSTISNERLRVIKMNMHAVEKEDLSILDFTIEIAHIDQLSRLLDRINQFPNVIEAKRKQG